jgi:hypothetical protein
MLKACCRYKSLGFELRYEVYDELRKVNLSFLKHPTNEAMIEIVQPISEGSEAHGLLQKYNNNFYHLCFEVDGLHEEISRLSSDGFVLVSKPMPAVAFENRLVAFLASSGTGIIELLESPSD